MKTSLLAGETLIKDGAANLQRGLETVGGRLYLTSQRLVFEPHAVNIQTEVAVLPLTAVTGARKCWTKFLNLIPIAPNSIAVSTTEGKDYRFVTWGREAWLAAIAGRRD
jgi:hypothetical protein